MWTDSSHSQTGEELSLKQIETTPENGWKIFAVKLIDKWNTLASVTANISDINSYFSRNTRFDSGYDFLGSNKERDAYMTGTK